MQSYHSSQVFHGGCSGLLIKFKTPTGVDRTVEMDTDDASAQGYVKKEKLDNFEFDLKSSYDKFCDAILGKMKELLVPEA